MCGVSSKRKRMLTIGGFVSEKFGSSENSPCCTPTGFGSKSPRHGLGSSKNIFDCVFVLLFNQYAQCDNRRSRREDISVTSFHESELFSGVYEPSSKSWSRSDGEIPQLCRDRFCIDFAGRQRGSSNIRGRADIFRYSRDWEIWPK
jgi:hypothetical protein